ncbi:MAG: hypothetical protein OXG55_08725 [bacterium]|nr:hypothetical protein [bacterium]MCY4103326.1 hypothetical protein [bacterium]
MTFWIQHGYGKADKIDTVADSDLLTGVILSPADEEHSTLMSTVASAQLRGIEVLLDPQLYIHTISGAVARCHSHHGLELGEISWFLSPDEIARHCQAVVTLNRDFGIHHVVSPAPYLASFGDVWAPVSLQYARATIELTELPVYLSLVAEDAAFADWDSTLRYLDALTTLDADGIYLIVGTSAQGYPVHWDSERLTNVLRVIYTLAELNHYEVIWGYSDLAGVLGVSVGAAGAATGWYHSLRRWTTDKWIPKSGGRQANPRIFVEQLLSTIEWNSEAINAVRWRDGPRVFPDSELRRRLREEGQWGIVESWNQHLLAMASLHQVVDRESDVSVRIASIRQRVEDALDLHEEIAMSRAAVSATHSSGLRALLEAIDAFAVAEEL